LQRQTGEEDDSGDRQPHAHAGHVSDTALAEHPKDQSDDTDKHQHRANGAHCSGSSLAVLPGDPVGIDLEQHGPVGLSVLPVWHETSLSDCQSRRVARVGGGRDRHGGGPRRPRDGTREHVVDAGGDGDADLGRAQELDSRVSDEVQIWCVVGD
jgi:hypothetical protein